MSQPLEQQHCKPCEGGIPPVNAESAKKRLADLPEWELTQDKTAITRYFEFKGFGKTISFVNAVAWIANQEMHHPDVAFGYNYCEVTYTTHAIEGLSDNDFICAAKVSQLLK